MTPKANTETARAFYDLMFNQARPREAIDRYAGERYVQHNPLVPDGTDGFVAYFERMAAEYPGKRVEIIRTVAQGDLVVVPAGKKHNFVNTGENPLILYTVYGPPEHADGAVHKTKEEADRLEEEGKDEPPTS